MSAVDRAVPSLRVRAANDRPLRRDGRHVLYWMTAQRRAGWNFALQRAVAHAQALGRPLIVLEALRCGYRWASDRLHAFVLQGMADNARAFAAHGVAYHPYVEPEPGAGRGLLAALAADACVVVTDDFPCFFLPRMLAAAAPRLPVLVEAVDGNGLLPLRAATTTSPSAYAFRRLLQKTLPAHLGSFPLADPLADVRLPLAEIPGAVAARWPAATAALLTADPAALARLPIDHTVRPAPVHGGPIAADATLASFLSERLPRYAEERNEIDDSAASGFSPYLHFGHLSAHQVAAAVLGRDHWSPANLATTTAGKREGWWGASAAAEAFLDELVTWRELGYNFSHLRPDDYDRYESLPLWTRATLEAHAGDPREHHYTLDQFATANTHDPLWNAAQRELRDEGRMHNYLRMLWGKKVLEWTAHPREALSVLIELNNRYALDGRNPNSYSGIFWCLGRFDRPWAPQRPIFGQIRYMSSANTARKYSVKGYLKRHCV